MKRLIRSTLSGMQCTKCDSVLPVNTLRYVTGGMHHCYICPTENKEAAEEELFWKLLINKVK